MIAVADPLTNDRAKALQSALSAGHNRPDRLQGLRIIFERLVKLLADELEKLSFLRPRLALIGITAGKYSEFCLPVPDSVEAVVRAEKWKGFACFTADRAASMAFIEAALGFDGTLKQVPQPVRPLSSTEVSLVTILFKRLARALTDAFASYVDATFEIKSIANREELALVAPADAAVIAARVSVDYLDRPGFLNIIIPQRLLEPMRDLLMSITPSNDAGGIKTADNDWTRQLSDEIARAFVKTKAVLDVRNILLSEVAAFKVGAVVPLSGNSITRICLEIDDNPLFWCELGRQNSYLALRIEDECDLDEIHIEDI